MVLRLSLSERHFPGGHPEVFLNHDVHAISM